LFAHVPLRRDAATGWLEPRDRTFFALSLKKGGQYGDSKESSKKASQKSRKKEVTPHSN